MADPINDAMNRIAQRMPSATLPAPTSNSTLQQAPSQVTSDMKAAVKKMTVLQEAHSHLYDQDK